MGALSISSTTSGVSIRVILLCRYLSRAEVASAGNQSKRCSTPAPNQARSDNGYPLHPLPKKHLARPADPIAFWAKEIAGQKRFLWTVVHRYDRGAECSALVCGEKRLGCSKAVCPFLSASVTSHDHKASNSAFRGTTTNRINQLPTDIDSSASVESPCFSARHTYNATHFVLLIDVFRNFLDMCWRDQSFWFSLSGIVVVRLGIDLTPFNSGNQPHIFPGLGFEHEHLAFPTFPFEHSADWCDVLKKPSCA